MIHQSVNAGGTTNFYTACRECGTPSYPAESLSALVTDLQSRGWDTTAKKDQPICPDCIEELKKAGL